MKFISWNVNGLRACVQKGFLNFFNEINADFFCLQETKLQEGQITLYLPGYEQYWCCAEKKGYSGTAIFTRHKPLSVRYGMGIEELDTEGRLITLEYPEFFLVTCYTPNAQRGLARIDHRLRWEEAFREYLAGLDNEKPVILCGDLNVAHQEIDLKNPASNRGNAGFSDQEREAFGALLDRGFTDTFRYLNPDAAGAYTWWSYMFNARQNNAGWRIDYFLVSDRLRDRIYRTPIHSEILGSDHCPVELDLDISCNGCIWPSESEGEATVVVPQKPDTSHVRRTVLAVVIPILTLAIGFGAGLGLHDTLFPQKIPSYLIYGPSMFDPSSSYLSSTDSLTPYHFSSSGLVSSVIPVETDEPEETEPVDSDAIISHSDNFITTIGDTKLEVVSLAPDDSSSEPVNYFTDGENLWRIGDATETGKQNYFDSNFWIRVKINAEMRRLAEDNGYGLQASFVTSDPEKREASGSIAIRSWLDDDGSLLGWFVYGKTYQVAEISISFYKNLAGYGVGTFTVTPLIDREDAMQARTEDLVTFVTGLSDIWVAGKNPDNFPIMYSGLLAKYPALEVLHQREDAPELLAKAAAAGGTSGIIAELVMEAIENDYWYIYGDDGK